MPNAPGQWLEWVDRYLPSPEGGEILSVGRDVTARHLAEIQLADSEARFRDLADKSSDIVWHLWFEPQPHFDYVSPSVESILGYPPAFFLDDFSRLVDVVDEDGRSRIQRAISGEQPLQRFDFRLRHADGSWVVVETRSTTVTKGMQGVTRDVTELRRLQEATAALALRDPLTGLANRRLFDELLDAELARTERAGVPLAVAYIDLDGLKQVNDTHGHDAGDHVLCESARRLVEVVRCRRGGAARWRRVRDRLRARRRIVDRAGGSHRRSAGAAVRDPRRRVGVVCCEHRLRRHRDGHGRCGRAAGGGRRRDVSGQAGASGRSVLTSPVRSGAHRANRRSDGTAGADAG